MDFPTLNHVIRELHENLFITRYSVRVMLMYKYDGI